MWYKNETIKIYNTKENGCYFRGIKYLARTTIIM